MRLGMMRLAAVGWAFSVLANAAEPAGSTEAAAGLQALQRQQFTTAVRYLKQAVEANQHSTRAWNDLARAYLALEHLEAAEIACRKQIDVSPESQQAYETLGLVLWRKQKYPEALEAFRQHLKLSPDDAEGHGSLGRLYCRLHHYKEAIAELEKAVAAPHGPASIKITLAEAYLGAGEAERAFDLLDRVVADEPTAENLNGAAYELAVYGIRLERAQQFALASAAIEEASLRHLDAAHIGVKELRQVLLMASFWDTLGWVQFQRGDLEGAARYLDAAWSLNADSGAIGDHLAQLYETRGLKPYAIAMYAKALATSWPLPETRDRLAMLLGPEEHIEPLIERARSEVEGWRAIHAGRLSREKAVADFYIVLAQAPTAVDAAFVSGDASLRDRVKALRGLTYPNAFPVASDAKIARRATLTCPGGDEECTLVFASASAALTAEMNAAPNQAKDGALPGVIAATASAKLR